MSVVLQNLLVFLVVAGCVAWVGSQAFRTLRGKRSKIGSCCARGCESPQTSERSKKPAGGVAFIPLERLSRRRRD
jgi:hypothetical protein